MTKLENSRYDKTQKLKLWQYLKYDESQFMKKKTIKGSFSINIWTPWQPMRCSLVSVLRLPLKCRWSANSQQPTPTATDLPLLAPEVSTTPGSGRFATSHTYIQTDIATLWGQVSENCRLLFFFKVVKFL